MIDFDFDCCSHCGCDEGDRIGHDDTCRYGCNDEPDLCAILGHDFYTDEPNLCGRCEYRSCN